MPKPTCATCPFFDLEAEVDVYPKASLWPMSVKYPPDVPMPHKGACRRYPQTMPHKRPDEWCGEHPRFRAADVECRA